MLSFLVPVAIGICIVLQGTLNKRVTQHWDLSSTVFLNGVVFFVVSVLLYGAAYLWPQSVPEVFRIRPLDGKIAWWYLLPGVFGFVIVAGLPFALHRLSAVQVFIFLIATQIVFSMVWDLMIEKQPFNGWRTLGALITVLGAAIVTMNS